MNIDTALLRKALNMSYDAISAYSPDYMHSLPKAKYLEVIQAAMMEILGNGVVSTEKGESLLRIYHILGDRKRGIVPIIPVSRATWYAGIKTGRYPKPTHLSNGVSVWRRSDIEALCKNKQSEVNLQSSI
jgi:predicted DNA-binding transcriptional regulator AlpA